MSIVKILNTTVGRFDLPQLNSEVWKYMCAIKYYTSEILTKSSKSTYPTRALQLHYRATWTYMYAVYNHYLQVRGLVDRAHEQK